MITSKGFTLIELLIAIFVITVGITGAFIAVQQGISVIDYANSRFTAALLAQEGVEIIKNIRDTNLLEGTAVWDERLGLGDFEVQYTDPRIMLWTDNYLIKDEHDFYNYNSGTEVTKFKRKIHIASTGDPNHLELEITVYWRKRGGVHYELTLRQDIYNWLNI